MEKIQKVLSFAIPVLLLVLGLYLTPLKIFGPNWAYVPGDMGDARFNNYILEHYHLYEKGKLAAFWDAPFLYPQKNVIAYSDNLLGTAPLYSLFRKNGCDRETAFQWWILSLFVLNYLACFGALFLWSRDSILSAVGAYIFAFSIMLVGNIYNVQTLPRFILPFLFYWFWIYLHKKDSRFLLYFLLGLVFQFYCGIYLGFLSLYLFLFMGIAYFLIYRDVYFFKQFKSRRIIKEHLVYLLLAFVCFFPLIQPYLEVSKTTQPEPFAFTLKTVPTLFSYFFTSDAPVLWKFLYDPGTKLFDFFWCHFLFIGALPWIGILLSIAVFVRKMGTADQRRFLSFLLLSLGLSFLFCLNFFGFSLYELIWHLPGFASMRSVNRIINTELVLFILVFVFVFIRLKETHSFITYVVWLLPLLVVADNALDETKIMRYAKVESQKEIGLVKQKIASQLLPNFRAIAYLPDSISNVVDFHLNTMLASQELGIACVNAYTGHFPSEYVAFFQQVNREGLLGWCKFQGIDSGTIQAMDGKGLPILKREKINLKGMNGNFVCADHSISPALIGNRSNAGDWETFYMFSLGNEQVSLMSSEGKFFCAEQGGGQKLAASREQFGAWEMFVLLPQADGKVAFQTFDGHFISMDPQTQILNAQATALGPNEKFELIRQ
jgi:hypothetical protein